MLKQDVPLRTGWFGYRKLDVENCIAHIRAAYAAELRLARQTQQGMDYAAAGFVEEGTFRDMVRLDGVYRDVVFMAKIAQ